MWTKRWMRRLGFWLTAATLSAAGAQAQIKEADRTGGPYVPTPQVVVDQIDRKSVV